MIKTSLWLRLSHKYRDGWSGEDSHRCLGEMRLTPRRLVKAQQDVDETPSTSAPRPFRRGWTPRR